MEMLHVSKETAFLIALGVFVYGFIGIWLWKTPLNRSESHHIERGEEVENHR